MDGAATAAAAPASLAAAPRPPDFDALWSLEGRSRRLAGLREIVAAAASTPGTVGLHGGFPPAAAFPLARITLATTDGREVVVDAGDDIYRAQQYSVALLGEPRLHAWASARVAADHAPPAAHSVVITNGNNPTLDAVFRSFLDRGDSLLVEEFTYPHIAESLVAPPGFVAVPVPLDGGGIVPEKLEAAIQAEKAAGRPTPKLLYTVPVGQNPTGTVTATERKRRIYAVCRAHGIIIVEDDPYYYLQFGPGGGGGGGGRDLATPRGLTNLGASYLSLDVDGRVVRLDSFSKVLTPGLRLGWATAAPAVSEKIAHHLHGVLLGAPALAQAVAIAILEGWGAAGFEAHVRRVQGEYARRAAVLHAALCTHAPPPLAAWHRPEAGMFFWVRLGGAADAADALASLTAAGVCVVPGAYAHCSGDRRRPCPFIRLSFAGATDQDLEAGAARLGDALREAARARGAGAA